MHSKLWIKLLDALVLEKHLVEHSLNMLGAAYFILVNSSVLYSLLLEIVYFSCERKLRTYNAKCGKMAVSLDML